MALDSVQKDPVGFDIIAAMQSYQDQCYSNVGLISACQLPVLLTIVPLFEYLI